jgi:hypothetical protein
MTDNHTHIVSASGISPCLKGLETDYAPFIANTPRTHAIIRNDALTVCCTEEWSWL